MRWGATSKSKYGNRKVKHDGEWFDSQRELDRWLELRLLERAGVIHALRRQVKYVLIPEQREPDTIGPRGGVRRGKLIERERSYWADFVYERDGQTVVEDAKGFKTDVYLLKKALLLHTYGIRIQEV